MRRKALKFPLLILPLATLLAVPVCYAQQDQPSQPQSPPPGTPAQPQQQEQPQQQPAKSEPPTTTPSPNQGESDQESSSKKVLPPENESAKKEKPHTAKAGVLPPEDDPAWDPFHAEQDIEVGTFYMHKGDMDAAISRFEDAIKLRANFAKPRLLLGRGLRKEGRQDRSRPLLPGISEGFAERARLQENSEENRKAFQRKVTAKRRSTNGDSIQEFHRAIVVRKLLFFLAECRSVRFATAARKAHGMLHVQHLVIHHVSHHKFRHVCRDRVGD